MLFSQQSFFLSGNVGVTSTIADNLHISTMSHRKRQSSDDEHWLEERCDQLEIRIRSRYS